MDEESSTAKEAEGSFHLSNWKKLIYIMAEIEKNVVEDSQRPQSQNIKEETLSNSRWSWPWKIHKGKVLSAKIDTTSKTIVASTISENFDNKQNQTNDSSSEVFSIMNEVGTENEEQSKGGCHLDYNYNKCLFKNYYTSSDESRNQRLKEDKVDVLYDIGSALGLMSNTNIVAMGIAIPKSIVCMSCDEKFRETFLPTSPIPVTTMPLDGNNPKINPQVNRIIYTDHDNNEEMKLEKNIQNSTPTIESCSSLPTNKIAVSVDICKFEDEENIVSSKKSETRFLCERGNENLDENECETANKFAASIKLATPFKENDNNTSQQTLNKLSCDTESRCKRSSTTNSYVSLVGNDEHKKGTTEGISISYPSSTSVVTEKRSVEECFQCVSAIKDEEKHLLMQEANKKIATNTRLKNFMFTKKVNDELEEPENHPNISKRNKFNSCSTNCSIKKICEEGCVSCHSALDCEQHDRSSLKGSDNFVKPSTFSNISIENSQGYRSIEKSFELH